VVDPRPTSVRSVRVSAAFASPLLDIVGNGIDDNTEEDATSAVLVDACKVVSVEDVEGSGIGESVNVSPVGARSKVDEESGALRVAEDDFDFARGLEEELLMDFIFQTTKNIRNGRDC
jgi:hypothetical protein